MSSLTGRFQRDLTYLTQNKVPLTVSGQEITSLDYAGEEFEKLKDEDVQLLRDALLSNHVFRGPLDLSNNSLTDQSGLFLADLFRKKEFHNISELNLSNSGIKAKAAQFIGDALIENYEYKVERLIFKDCDLEENGFFRILDASRFNSNIKKLHVGITSSKGLNLLSTVLSGNKGLQRLEFQESEQNPWDDKANKDTYLAISKVIKNDTELEYVKFTTFRGEEDESHAEFKSYIDYFTNKKLTQHKNVEKFERRQEQCNPDSMFEQMIQLIEDKEQQRRMPVRKFFNNTFGTILNDAIFALKKKQSKEQDNEELFTKKGSVKFVAMYILENLPQHEREPDLYESNDSNDEA